jgi:polyferredoxin
MALFIDEFFLVLAAVLFLAFLLLWVTVVYGRIWCGWLCPQMLLTDLTTRRSRTGLPGRPGLGGHLLAAALSVLVGAASVWYFVPPQDFFWDLSAGTLPPVAAGAWAALSLLTWLDLWLVRERFCASVCPYAKIQVVLFDRHTLAIVHDHGRAEECIACATRLDQEGRVVAAYVLAIANRGARPARLALGARHPARPARVTPAAIEIAPGARRRFPVYTVAPPGAGLQLSLEGAAGSALARLPHSPPAAAK